MIQLRGADTARKKYAGLNVRAVHTKRNVTAHIIPIRTMLDFFRVIFAIICGYTFASMFLHTWQKDGLNMALFYANCLVAGMIAGKWFAYYFFP